MNALNIRSWADVRSFAYVLLPVLTTLAVTLDLVTDDQAVLWAGLATAILGPVVQFIYTKNLSTFRAGFYAVLGAVVALLVGYNLFTDEQVGVWLPLITAIVGGTTAGVARENLRQQTAL